MNRFMIRAHHFAAIVLLLTSTFSAAGAPADSCRSASSFALEVNRTHELVGELDLTDVFLEVPRAGQLAVEVTESGGARSYQNPTFPWLEFLPNACSAEGTSILSATSHLLDSGHHLVQVPAAGVYRFRLGSVGSDEVHPLYRWSSVLLPPAATGNDGGEGDGTEEPDIQILPVVYPQPKNPKGAALTQALPLMLRGLSCPAGAEPANDLALCAQHLSPGTTARATLDSDLDLDQDYFVFDLDESTRVRIETQGTQDTVGVLFDAFGHRLLSDDDGGDDENFSLTSLLGPGRYFVRVEGAASSVAGPYDLQLRSLDR